MNPTGEIGIIVRDAGLRQLLLEVTVVEGFIYLTDRLVTKVVANDMVKKIPTLI